MRGRRAIRMEIQRLRVIIWRRSVKQKLLSVFIIAVGLLVVSTPMFAHHGVAGYDLTKTITVHGTVTKFDWSNPHCVIHIDAKNAMKAGDDITADLHPAQTA